MEQLKHECGVAMIRLLKPLEYYRQRYGTGRFAFSKLYLMMEKQHNRGQEGAGIACVNLDSQPGEEYIFRERAEGKDAVTKIFAEATKTIVNDGDDRNGSGWTDAKLFMGHLRYSTTGKGGLTYVHPFLRRNNWRAKNLCLCGNFNMANIDDVFDELVELGMAPRVKSDTFTLLELMGHRLDREAERNYVEARNLGLEGKEITHYIDNHIDMANVLRSTMPHFDGGYVMCGMTGSGEFFSMRDPWGIRPAFYYANDDFVVVASERPVLQTTFDLPCEEVRELQPGQSIIVNRAGELRFEQILPARNFAACSFERIYFSRGNDRDIHNERKQLGYQLRENILSAIGNDIQHTVFSFIPNTAEVAYYGMCQGMEDHCGHKVRAEKVVWKDIKLRTFITESDSRNDLAAHVYDITFGIVRPKVDNLVVIDDSIVRGTTLRESIIKILNRLQPKKIVIVSSAPQVRYPDFYGIDMSYIGDFIAFQATIALLRERGQQSLIDRVYEECKKILTNHVYEKCKKKELSPVTTDKTCRTDDYEPNPIRALYEPFTADELNRKMVDLLRPEGIDTPIELVFQSIEGLHKAIPHHPGDWYFTGHYPTPGGQRLALRSFINWYEKVTKEE